MPRKNLRQKSKRVVREVDLVPLSSEEIDAFLERQIAEYAEEKRRAGHWSGADAQELSRKSVMAVVGPDPMKGDHRFFKGTSEDGACVGWIWVGLPPGEFHLQRARWLYQILVEEDSRGRGFGRAMLVALEDLLSGAGVEALHLNVFKWNLVARSLYDSMGYEVVLETETEAGMRKRLRRHSRRIVGGRKRRRSPRR